MRRIAWTFLLVAGTACASKQSSPELAPSSVATSMVVQAGGSQTTSARMSLVNTSTAHKELIAMPVDKAWVALDKAYAALGIKPTVNDAAHHTLGSSGFKVRRKLGDVPLIRALDCGGDSSSPNSESYEITLSVSTQLSPDASGGTLIQTLVEGIGRNALTNNSNQVPCYSSGGIEKRIADLVRQASNDKAGTTVVPVKKPK